MYRGQDQDPKTRLPVVLKNLHDNRPLRTGLERSEEETQLKANRPGRRGRLHGAPGKRTLIAAAVAIAMIGGGFAGVRWWLDGRYIVSTDDAYVLAHSTTQASKISGYVDNIPVADNARIKAGDVIATIDAGDYRLAVEAARDKAATQQATASAGKSSPMAPLSIRPKRNLSRRRRMPRRRSLNSRGSRLWPSSSSPASRFWSRPKPIAIRPRPRCRAHNPSSMPL
jgi:hypothetical protein